MLNVRRLLASLLIIALALAGVGAVAAQETDTPSLTVEDQYLYITVATVMSDGPGWVVVHADDNGSPGDVIGYTQVDDGENTDVEVQLDPTQITETLHVMLHEDTGEEGVFDFPDADPPVQVDGETLTTTINLQTPDVDDVDPDADPTPTPVDEDVEATPTPTDVEATPTPTDVEATPTPTDVEATPTPEDDEVDPADVEETPTPTPTPADDEVDATPTPMDDEVDVTPTPDDDEVVEVIPELGANIPMLPMLGLAAAGALLLGVGFVFAYRKQD